MDYNNKIRIHCFEPTSIEGFPSNTYVTNNVNSALDCIKDILENKNSGISRILIENPGSDDHVWDCYGRINAMSPMDLDKKEELAACIESTIKELEAM